MGYVLQLIILENELLKDIIINISIILRKRKRKNVCNALNDAHNFMILSMMIIIVIVFINVSSGSCELISTDHCHVCVKGLKSLRFVFVCFVVVFLLHIILYLNCISSLELCSTCVYNVVFGLICITWALKESMSA